MAIDPLTRFSDRVRDYVAYRPRYPDQVLSWLQERGLSPSHVVADVGSGTGILTELLLRAGCSVVAVEPNPEMRRAAEAALGEEPGYRSISGSAEATTLESGSIDLITVGQAFHWFDPIAAKREFARILRPGGRLALIWNDRQTRANSFMRGYEKLLDDWGRDYRKASYHHRPLAETLTQLFDRGSLTTSFPNQQALDEEGLVGRFFSASYTPGKEEPQRAAAEDAARQLFRAHQEDGVVVINYLTTVELGEIGRPTSTPPT